MWWFKQAVLNTTFADAQAMHPWFLDYANLEPGVRELVWTLNQTDMAVSYTHQTLPTTPYV